jgi:hypothetical protein
LESRAFTARPRRAFTATPANTIVTKLCKEAVPLVLIPYPVNEFASRVHARLVADECQNNATNTHAHSGVPFPSSGTRRKCDGGRLSIKSHAGPTTEHWIRDSWRARHRLEPIHAADRACAANRRDVRSVEYFSRSQRDFLSCLSPSCGLPAARYRHDFGPLGCNVGAVTGHATCTNLAIPVGNGDYHYLSHSEIVVRSGCLNNPANPTRPYQS